MNPPSVKHYRKFGPVTVDSANKVLGEPALKIIRPEQWVRIRPDTGECLFEQIKTKDGKWVDGDLIVKKIDKKEERKDYGRNSES